MQHRITNKKVIFSLLVTLTFGYATWEALNYSYLARIFPLSISITFLIVASINLVQDIRRFQKEQSKAEDIRKEMENSHKIEDSGNQSFRIISMKEVSIAIGFLYLAIWLIGYPLSLSIFITLFYGFIIKTDWIFAAIAGIIGFDFIILITEILALDLPAGLIPLPWPFG